MSRIRYLLLAKAGFFMRIKFFCKVFFSSLNLNKKTGKKNAKRQNNFRNRVKLR